MINKFLAKVLKKRNAYRAIFTPGGLMSPSAQVVLADLRNFCRADRSTVIVSSITQQTDTHAMAVAEGRREVWLRIMQNIHVSDADLYNLLKEDNSDDNS